MVRNASLVQDIARQRIDRLINMAAEKASSRPDLSRRYISMALTISRRTRIRIPRSKKRLFCKKCTTFLLPGKTARVRVRQHRSPHVSVCCLVCGHVKRYPLRRSG
uniref:Ribonuclease P protein component 4 n=1 Tax=Candidatus Methanomethylicus mesodigestus TaxID=1867258 RepID=A0A7C3J3P8_9CREN